MECPYCGEELTYEDYFRKTIDVNKVLGDIWECHNLDCQATCFYVYRDGDGDLIEGYPC